MSINDETRRAHTADERRMRSCPAATVVSWVAIGAVLYVAHAAVIPVCLALLFALVLSAPVEALHEKGIPRNVSALAIVVLVFSGFVGIASWTWNPARDWFAKAPQTMTVLRQKVNPVARLVNRLDDLRKNAGTMGATGRTPAPPAAVVKSDTAPSQILDMGGTAIASLLAVVIVTVFLLAGGPPMMARMAAAFPDNLSPTHVQHVLEEVRAEVGRFYLVTSLINLGLGIATSAAMWAWGMPTPYLWGALAAMLNFIPYMGPAATLGVISLVAIVSFDTLGQVLGVAGTFVALSTIEGQVAQPLLVGHRLNVNPLLIFLGLWFGGLFWGIAGIVLATPILVTLKVVAKNTDRGQAMLEFLGPNEPGSGSRKSPGGKARVPVGT